MGGHFTEILRGPIDSAPLAAAMPDWVFWLDDTTGPYQILYRPLKQGETAPSLTHSNGWIPISKWGTRLAQAKITSANYVFNKVSNTIWYEIDSTNLRLSVTALAGDNIEIRISGIWFSEAPTIFMDCATVVSGSPVHWLGSTGGTGDFGIAACYGVPSILAPFSVSLNKTLVNGDISGGTVTISPFIRINTINSNKTLFGVTSLPFQFEIENKGPVLVP